MIIYEILLMCLLQIDPRFDKNYCMDQMIQCTQKASFENCSEYWEPLHHLERKYEYNSKKDIDATIESLWSEYKRHRSTIKKAKQIMEETWR